MSRKEKLIKRFKRLPNDFTFDELTQVFSCFGFHLDHKGSTSGSRVSFIGNGMHFDCHKPHPGNIVRKGTLRDVYNYLLLKGLL